MQSALSSTIRHFNTSVYTSLYVSLNWEQSWGSPTAYWIIGGSCTRPSGSLGFAYSPKWDEDVTLNVIFSHIHGGSACQCRGKKESIDEIHHGDWERWRTIKLGSWVDGIHTLFNVLTARFRSDINTIPFSIHSQGLQSCHKIVP